MSFLNISLRYADHNYLSIFERLLILVLLMLPITLVSGPFLSDLSVVIISIIFIFFSILEKNYKFYKSFFFISFMFIYLNLLFSSFFSENILFSLESSLFYFRFIFFVLAVWYIFEKYSIFNIYFLYVLLFTNFFLSMDALFQFFYGYNILGFEYDNHRLSGLFGKEEKLGSFLSRIMPIMLSLYFYNLKKFNLKIKLLIISICTLSALVILLTGERVAVFYIFLLYISLILISFRNIKFLLSIVIISIIVISIFSNNKKMYNNFIYRNIISTLEQTSLLNNDLKNLKIQVFSVNESLFKKENIEQNALFTSKYLSDFISHLNKKKLKNIYNEIKNEEIYIFSYSYHQIYLASFSIIKKNFPYGIGPKMFRSECERIEHYSNLEVWISRAGCSTHPHNSYLQLFLETGLPVVVIFLLFFTFVIYKLINILIRFYITNDLIYINKYFLYLALFITLLPLQPTGSVFNNWNSIIYYLPLGIILKEIYHKSFNKHI